MSESESTRSEVARNSPLLVGLAWASLVTGGILVWMQPRPNPVVDTVLAPLAAFLLYRFVQQWTDRRGAWTAVVVYTIFLVAYLTLLVEVPGALATRNLGVSGNAQLLVALSSLLVLRNHAVSPLLWSVVVIAASGLHPQFAFVTLLMITIVEWRTVLTPPFLARARGAALRCAALSIGVQLVLKVVGMRGVPHDAVTLPLAWWLASWLLDGEPLMSVPVRALVTGILCVSTVADFKTWPALAVVLLLAWLFSSRRPSPEGSVIP